MLGKAYGPLIHAWEGAWTINTCLGRGVDTFLCVSSSIFGVCVPHGICLFNTPHTSFLLIDGLSVFTPSPYLALRCIVIACDVCLSVHVCLGNIS